MTASEAFSIRKREEDEFRETDAERRPGIVSLVEQLQKAASVQEKYLFEHREVIGGILKPDTTLDSEPTKNSLESNARGSSPLRDQLEELLEQINLNSRTLTNLTGRVDN